MVRKSLIATGVAKRLANSVTFPEAIEIGVNKDKIVIRLSAKAIGMNDTSWFASNMQKDDGWIALAAAILCGISVDEALHRACDIPFGRRNQRNGGCGISEKVISLYREKPELHNSEIAATIGCTREMVRIVLKKHGVPKRNKWEGHISLDPRYYKCVK